MNDCVDHSSITSENSFTLKIQNNKMSCIHTLKITKTIYVENQFIKSGFYAKAYFL